jgi:hypothetical protein
MPPKAASVAAQMKKEAESRPNREPTVRLRVLPNEKGFYGYPVASIITEGVEFNHRIKDLEVFKPGMKNYGGKQMRTITIPCSPQALAANKAEYEAELARIEKMPEAQRAETKKLAQANKTAADKGTVYCLPAWCESAKDPSSMIPKEEVDETFAMVDEAATGEM